MDTLIETKCDNCGEVINPEEWGGWYDIILNIFGFEIKVPICNSCNLRDDGVSGAY